MIVKKEKLINPVPNPIYDKIYFDNENELGDKFIQENNFVDKPDVF